MNTASTIPMQLTRDGQGDLPPPPWVAEVYGLRQAGTDKAAKDELSIRVADSEDAALVTARVRDAVGLDANELQRRVAGAYDAIRSCLSGTNARHAVRVWNYIPSITDRMPDGRDRYMVFNAGRFDAFCNWYGGPERFDRHVPTASGVGHAGADLVIHCLAAARPGVAVSNPRQVQPFHYSQRFGPLPPCFVRATVVREPSPLVLVGGTASIRGEDSLHALDFAGQMGETLANLAAMVYAAGGRTTPPPAGDLSPLKRYRHLRVYLPDGHRAGSAADVVAGLFPGVGQIEWLHADLCRPELLVEIEGVAELL